MPLSDYTVVDLTHTLTSQVPTWTGDEDYQHIVTDDFAECGFRISQLNVIKAGVGTHMDAPLHRFEGKADIASIELSDLIRPVVVLHLADKIQDQADYQVSIEDILAHEKNHGEIGDHSWVIFNTGWSRYWSEPLKYRNQQGETMLFPTISQEAGELLSTRDITGIGIDTLSPDLGPDFPLHDMMLGNDRIILENLTQCDKLPARGAYLLALPPKFSDATEAPVRVIGLIENK